MNIQILKVLGFLFLNTFCLLVNAQITCPDYITCTNVNIFGGAPVIGLGYNTPPEFEFNEEHHFTVFWGHGNPIYGEWDYYLSSNHSDGSFSVSLYDGFENNPNCGIPEFAQITLPDGTPCSFNYGVLCHDCPFPEPELEGCTDWLSECGDGLYEFLERANLQGSGCEQWSGDCGIESSISRRGLTMIGTDSEPSSLDVLAVRGGVLTSKVKITSSDDAPGWGSIENGNAEEWWCDYVFDDNYNLMPLLELEKFISENKHLPRTPSAAEVKEEGGYEIGSVLFNHQEKVEEIFLHMIDLNKQIAEMKNELK